MKKILKYFLLTIAFLFVMINIFVAIHSYKFTHVTDAYKTEYRETLQNTSLTGKLKTLFTGVDIPRYTNQQILNDKYQTITIPVDEHRQLDGWYIPTDSVQKGIVLVFHGYGDNKASMLDVSDEMLKFGYDVLLVDFMGTGNSYGDQTTMGYLEAENVFATYNYALSTLHEDNIFLYGFSMGAVAVMKAQHDYHMNVGGIMLQAPYATLEGTIEARAKQMGVPQQPISALFTFWIGQLNGFDGFEAKPIEDASTIEVPTLVMCGLKDPHIPKEETEAIFEAIGAESKTLKLFEDAKHESLLKVQPNEWQEAVDIFLTEIEKSHIHATCKEFFTESLSR